MDRKKIATMAKLAVYDKKGFEKDVVTANHYFRHDYIYKKNMQMRFWLGVGCLILALFYALRLFETDGIDIFALDFQAEFVRLLTFALIVMVAYSALGTIIFTREFLIAQKRVNAYFELMKELGGFEDLETASDFVSNDRGRLRAKGKPATTAEESAMADERPPVDFRGSAITAKRSAIPFGKPAIQAMEEEEKDFEDSEPYRKGNARQYRIRSTDDPEFWEDKE